MMPALRVVAQGAGPDPDPQADFGLPATEIEAHLGSSELALDDAEFNGSSGYGTELDLHLLDDKLRVQAGGADVDIRYRYYGAGRGFSDLDLFVEIQQDAPIVFGTASYRVWSDLYVGLGLLRGEITSRLRFGLPDALLPPEFYRPWIRDSVSTWVR